MEISLECHMVNHEEVSYCLSGRNNRKSILINHFRIDSLVISYIHDLLVSSCIILITMNTAYAQTKAHSYFLTLIVLGNGNPPQPESALRGMGVLHTSLQSLAQGLSLTKPCKPSMTIVHSLLAHILQQPSIFAYVLYNC